MVSNEEEWLWEAELSLPRLSANRGHEVLQVMQAKQGLPAVLQARGFLWTLRTAAQGRLTIDDSVTGTLTALGILAEDARDEFAAAGVDFTQLIPDTQLIRNVRCSDCATLASAWMHPVSATRVGFQDPI